MIRLVMRVLAAFGIVLAGWLVLPNPASARVWFGFGVPFPFVVGPPAYYYPPPAYTYRAPPVPPYPSYTAPYYQPGPRYTASSQSCITGGAVCPMEHPVAAGSSCYCSTGQGRAWGRAT